MAPDVEPELVLEGVTIVRRSSKFLRGSAKDINGFFSVDMGSATLSVFSTFSLLLRCSPLLSLLLSLEVSLL